MRFLILFYRMTPKTLQFFCILFYCIKENFLHPTRAIKFSRIFQAPPPPPPSPIILSCLLRFNNFLMPTPRLFQPPLLLGVALIQRFFLYEDFLQRK